MDGGFVVLGTWLGAVRCQKSEHWRYVWVGARCEPVDGAHNSLVDFGLAREIWIGWVRAEDGINWDARSIGGHVRDPVHSVYIKLVSNFGECFLGKRDRDVIVFVMVQLGERCAEEVIYVPHKIHIDMCDYLLFKAFLFFRVGGVKDEVIHIHTDVNFPRGGWQWG